MFPIGRVEGCGDREVNDVHNYDELEEYPLKINASSVAIPSRLLATSSIFPRTLSMSGNQTLSYYVKQ